MPKVGKDKNYTQKSIAFYKWLKNELYEKGITQKRLAEEIGITDVSMTNHFKNRVPFNYIQLIGIFNYLNVPEEQIAKLLKTER